MVLSQWEYSCASSTESQEVKELFMQRNNTANFYPNAFLIVKFKTFWICVKGKAVQPHVLHLPLDYRIQEPAGGPGNDIKP